MSVTQCQLSWFTHLIRLSDPVGLFEHARGAEPRLEHGYCVDDVARALVVIAREPDPQPAVLDLVPRFARFVADAVAADGAVHNRREHGGGWTDRPGTGDPWGRALWGLGAVLARFPELDALTRPSYERAAGRCSVSPRSQAFAALGAAEVLRAEPEHTLSRGLVERATEQIYRATVAMSCASAGRWPWPEQRLAYANAVLSEALILGGVLLEAPEVTEVGLAQLDWLVSVQTSAGGHLSVVPAHGWCAGEAQPGYDQQPIEIQALADAAARAATVTQDRRWDELVLLCEAWFHGANDQSAPLWDTTTGAGYDGLMMSGRNDNRGAESTLALLSTLQQAERARGRGAVAPAPVAVLAEVGDCGVASVTTGGQPLTV